jgi:hypothetical protein
MQDEPARTAMGKREQMGIHESSNTVLQFLASLAMRACTVVDAVECIGRVNVLYEFTLDIRRRCMVVL